MENVEQEVDDTEEVVEDTEEEVDETEEEVEEADDDSKDWKAEALKYKAIAQRKAKQAEKPIIKDKKEKTSSPEQIDYSDEVLSLLTEYTPQEAKALRDTAKQFGVPVKDLLDNETFKLGFESKREKDKADGAVPSQSKRVATFGPKKKAFSELSTKEKKANWNKVVGNYAGKGKTTE